MTANEKIISKGHVDSEPKKTIFDQPFCNSHQQTAAIPSFVTPLPLIVGGTDGSGTRSIVSLLIDMGVPFLYEVPDTFDVSGVELSGGREVKDPTRDGGWPAVVRDALRHGEGRFDYGYDGKELGGAAAGIKQMLNMHELNVDTFMHDACVNGFIGRVRCRVLKTRDTRIAKHRNNRDRKMADARKRRDAIRPRRKMRPEAKEMVHKTVPKIIYKEWHHRRLNQLNDNNTHSEHDLRHRDTREFNVNDPRREMRSGTEKKVHSDDIEILNNHRKHEKHKRQHRRIEPNPHPRTMYFAALPEIRAKSVSYGIKAPASMLLLPVFHQIYSARNTIEKKNDDVPGAGGFKYLQVIRDGRDISFSKNQSPVEKFYDLYNPGKYSGSDSFEEPAMELWNDWNVQAHNWVGDHSQQSKTSASLLDHATVRGHTIRVEDTVSEDISVRFSAFKSVATFVGSTLTDEEICCLANKDRSKKIGKQKKAKDTAVTYGKWKEKLKDKPELSKELHDIGSEGLKLFGYEPPQSILDCKGSHGNYVCEDKPDMCSDLPIKSEFKRGSLRICEVFPDQCKEMDRHDFGEKLYSFFFGWW